MEKQKLTLPVTKWGTVKSKYKPESNYVLNDEFTAGSINFITNNTGGIEKRPTDVLYNTTSFSVGPKDQFEAIFSSGVHHLLTMDGGSLTYTTGNRVISSAAAGFTPSASMEYSMYQNRVYMDNGIDNPRVYDLTTSYGGVSYSVPQVKQMGCQVPGSAPTFGADTSGGSVPLGGHTYVVTFLYYSEEESNQGATSILHTVSGSNQTVHLTAVPIGSYGVTARKIYRDNNDGNYLLVGTISDNTTTTFTDSVGAGTTAIPVSQNLPPIFSYLTTNLSRIWVAGVPGTPSVLYWSLPDFPDIFDPNNFIICNPKDPITAVYTFQGVTVVFNRHSFGKILGNTDDTFYYDEVPGTVGCVDNRSIQIRTLDGVPVLVWLSDRGFYKFDGSSVTYISDAIEDQVNFNLQQVSFTTGSNNQSKQSDYQGGTSSPSIDLDSDPGVITVLNPKRTFQSEADWEGGVSLTNLATADGTNQLKVPTYFAPTLASGALGGSAVISGSAIVLPTVSDFTGDTTGLAGGLVQPAGMTKIAVSFSPAASGTLVFAADQAEFGTMAVYTDAFGFPGVSIGVPGSLVLSAGTTYWLVWTFTGVGAKGYAPGIHSMSGGGLGAFFNGFVWQSVSTQVFGSYRFSVTPVSSSGTWVSPVYDSASVGSAVSNILSAAGTYPTSCSATVYVDMSNDPTLSTGVTTYSQANPSGTYSPALSNNRYWRIRYAIATTDNRRTPSVAVPQLTFNTVGTWISQPIDCTTDVTAYGALQITENLPAGTSVAVTAATSSDNITYSSFVDIGSAVVNRWIKIKVVLTTTSDNISTPSISLLKFVWTQTSTFTSSAIDVGQVPTGWGVFQNASALNGGTLTFYMRSASSSIGLAAATYFVVSNGVFPPAGVAVLEFTQWKIVFTSSADALPTVSGVTVNWFIGTAQSPIRAASLFFNKTYYLSAATIGSTTNNIVFVWDFENLWRVFTGVTIDSLGLFFNEPFYCDSSRNNIYQWLIAPTGDGSAISMDVRTKAYDLGNINVLKNVRSLRVTGMNTGTTIHAYYSVDRGTTWIEMLNVDGTTGYTTATDGNKFSEYFVTDYSGSNLVSGTTIMFRVTSADAFPCVILGLEPVLYTRSGKYLERPI